MKQKTRARKKLTLGVREFALPLVRKGSLGSTSFSALPIDLGQEIHEAIQARLLNQGDYKPELPLQTVLEGERYDLKIRGRCDGFFPEENTLEEIKSTFGLSALQDALSTQLDHPYILQTKMYGFLHYIKTGKIARLQLRLVDSRTLAEEILPVPFDPKEFELWVVARIGHIETMLARYSKLIKTRKALAKKLFFPFPHPRPKQTELVDSVRSTLEKGRSLLLAAPTGLGKTAGVLYPALEFALGRGSPVVYVAPKNSQFKAAVDLAALFQRSRIGLKVLVLTSKAKACLKDEVLCQSSSCAFARDYYDKVEAAGLVARDAKKHLWDARYFRKLSEAYEICPYEISMERVREADLIICDYNYVFSPHANFLDRYLDPIIPMTKPVLVIDEAHNLYERVIENYSPEIRLSSLKAFLATATSSADKRLTVIVNKAIALMAKISPLAAQTKISIDQAAIKELLDASLSLMTSRWGEQGLPGTDNPLFQFFTLWFDFHEMIDFSRETVPLIYKREDGDEVLRAQCIDPSDIIAPLYLNFLGVIAFSATLKPFNFYRHMSGFSEELTDAIEFESPFPRSHKKIMIIPQVLTSYRERDRHYQRIATIIDRIASLKEGAYLVFFSSYQFLKKVHAELPQDKGWPIFAQSSSLNAAQISAVGDLLDNEGTQLILAVQGGSLSEGIDFRGKGIRGVFIVGPAVPTASFERKLMQDHFEKLYGDGRSYAYVYPSMTKSVQAAGRVVRDEIERGVIVLMDPRFLEKAFQETMPGDWFEGKGKGGAGELVPKQIVAEVEAFWRETGSPSKLDRDPRWITERNIPEC